MHGNDAPLHKFLSGETGSLYHETLVSMLYKSFKVVFLAQVLLLS